MKEVMLLVDVLDGRFDRMDNGRYLFWCRENMMGVGTAVKFYL
jgi:hypothetical protein